MGERISVTGYCEACGSNFEVWGRVNSIEGIMNLVDKVHKKMFPECTGSVGNQMVGVAKTNDIQDYRDGETTLALLPKSEEEGLKEKKRVDDFLTAILGSR